MAAKPKPVLIVGAGRIGGLNEADADRKRPCTHAGAVISQPGLRLAGVVDVARARAEAMAATFETSAFDDLAKALVETRPEIVMVAVPYRHNREAVEQLLDHPDRPRKLLVEKPLAHDLASAEAIVLACEERGVRLLVNNECAAPVYGRMRQSLEEDLRGEAISVSAWCSSGLHAVGIHLIGAMRYLFGDVAWVRAIGETERVENLPFSTNFQPDDPRVHGMLMFRSGVTGFLTNSALTQYTYKEIEVTCRGGRLRLSDNGSRLDRWTTATPGTSTISYRLSGPKELDIPAGTVFSVIGDYLASDDPDAGQDVLGGREGLETYRVLDAMVRSAAGNREVQVAVADRSAA